MDTSQDNQRGLNSRGKRRLLWPLLLIGTLLALSTVLLFVNVSKELEPQHIGDCFAGSIEGLGGVQLQLKFNSTNVEGDYVFLDGEAEGRLNGHRIGNSAFKLESVVWHRPDDEQTNGVFQLAIVGNPPVLRGAWMPAGATQQAAVELRHIAKLMKLHRGVGLSIAGYGGTKDSSAEFPMFSTASPFHANANREMLSALRQREHDFNEDAFAHVWEGIRMPGASWAWDEQTDIQVVHLSDAVISVRAIAYAYTGGAHGNSAHGGWNWVAVNGQVVRFGLKDLFQPESDWLRRLEKNCVSDLMRQEASDIGGLDHQFKAEELESFTVSRAGVQIYFSPYQVGSYAEGAFTVHVPWEVLRPCLRADGPAKYLTEAKASGN